MLECTKSHICSKRDGFCRYRKDHHIQPLKSSWWFHQICFSGFLCNDFENFLVFYFLFSFRKQICVNISRSTKLCLLPQMTESHLGDPSRFTLFLTNICLTIREKLWWKNWKLEWLLQSMIRWIFHNFETEVFILRNNFSMGALLMTRMIFKKLFFIKVTKNFT